MRLFLLSTLLATATATAISSQAPILLENEQDHAPGIEHAERNAAAIFNTLHGSMRQWDSSLHHNGMSFFRVSVPANTLFYHGTHTAERVKGMEWLAFEIEHAEVFARARRPGGRRPPRPPPGEGGPPPPFFEQNIDEAEEVEGKEDDLYKPYLHTYRTTRPLTNLLYIDGMSAGKTSMGTLDTQDLVLLQDVNLTSLPGFGDFNRAQMLCELTPNIEGYLRMEAGFEIILCDFENGLELVSAFERPQDENRGELFEVEYFRGVGTRYQGIGGGRVSVDYSSMVSAYFHPLNLTNPDSERRELPRLHEDDYDGLKKLKEDALGLFASEEGASVGGIDWQGVTDMIVTRFADRIAFMALDSSTGVQMLAELNFLLTHSMDAGSANRMQAKETCAQHYLPPSSALETQTDKLLQSSLLAITREICGTLFDVQELLAEGLASLSHSMRPQAAKITAKKQIESLMHFLDWSRWLECGKCEWDEICFVAIWPWGSKKDHEHPGCGKFDQMTRGGDYWGHIRR